MIFGKYCQLAIKGTRSYAALRAADLDWIVGLEYSLGRNKQKRDLLTRGHNWPFRCLENKNVTYSEYMNTYSQFQILEMNFPEINRFKIILNWMIV